MRNARVFKGEKFSPAWTSKEALGEFTTTIEALSKERGKARVKSTEVRKRSMKLKDHHLKVNTNGAWESSTKAVGCGCIIRNS